MSSQALGPHTDPNPSSADVALVRHRKRQDWGVAALLWERDGKRGYQFSDGNLRVFKRGFYHLLESAEPPEDGSAKAVRRLARLARADELTAATRLPTLRDQISLFRRHHPEGFAGKSWQREHRGAGIGKRLKRHRDPAIEEAQRLTAEQLEPLIASFSWPEIHARLLHVAGNVDLISSAQLRKLEALTPSRELATALRDWVSGEADEPELERRFKALVRVLDSAASWPVVTAIAGLVDPEYHVCVRPSVFEFQAKMLLTNFRPTKRPSYAGYRQYRHVAQTVFDELVNAGLPPSDLLDVHDFIAETLRPAARDELIRQHELRSVEHQAA
ncbi:MAG TPA: hypothetical protein VK034_14335 [Enhygromyxa sp.]|nr:hypothetical protein [Enhygromyxa sp.]